MDKATIAVYDARAAEYADFVTREKEDPSLQVFMEALPSGARVLDLGCGNGASSAVMVDHGFNVTAVDASLEMVKICEGIQGVTARQSTFDDVIRDVPTSDNLYTGIWANFSLLHVSKAECRRVMLGLNTLCQQPAWLHIGMKTGDGEQRDRLGRHYVYYSDTELQSLMADAGFELQKTIVGESAGLAGDLEPWMTLLGVRR